MIFVDGVDIGDPADVALRDRRMLSADGIFIVVATISEQAGPSRSPTPRSSCAACPSWTRSTAYRRHPRRRRRLAGPAAAEEMREIDLLQQYLHDDLAAFVYERLRRRPMVLPVVVEV